MYFQLNCPICTFSEDRLPESYIEPDYVLASEKRVFHLHCSQGHSYQCVTYIERFEVLFDISVWALLDGYTREAVLSASASAERFHAFYAKVLAVSMGRPADDVGSAWKSSLKYSERQIGAFFWLYYSVTGKRPAHLADKKFGGTVVQKFRNDVVHEGLIPSQVEAADYLKIVFDYIHDLMWEMRDKFGNFIDTVSALDWDTTRVASAPQAPISVAWVSALGFARGECENSEAFSDGMLRIKHQRDRFIRTNGASRIQT